MFEQTVPPSSVSNICLATPGPIYSYLEKGVGWGWTARTMCFALMTLLACAILAPFLCGHVWAHSLVLWWCRVVLVAGAEASPGTVAGSLDADVVVTDVLRVEEVIVELQASNGPVLSSDSLLLPGGKLESQLRLDDSSQLKVGYSLAETSRVRSIAPRQLSWLAFNPIHRYMRSGCALNIWLSIQMRLCYCAGVAGGEGEYLWEAVHTSASVPAAYQQNLCGFCLCVCKACQKDDHGRPHSHRYLRLHRETDRTPGESP